MDPNAKGWLRRYCELIDSDESTVKNQYSLSQYEKQLYKLLQPTGIMYGHPVRDLGTLAGISDTRDPVSRMKLIFTESLLCTASLRLEANQSDISGVSFAEHLIPEIPDYFLNIYPNLYQGRSTGYLKDPYYLAENLIGKRVSIKTSMVKNYLASLFHNSMLFLDVYYFGEWVNGFGSASLTNIRHEQNQLRLTIIGIMALAAQADSKLQKEERALFEFFLKSANLTKSMEREARSMLINVKHLSEVDIPEVENWILRKYLLEMAILITLADKEMNEQEHNFIIEFGGKLAFTKDEVSESILAVESFVLNNWSAMHYLVGKGNIEKVGYRFVTRLKGFINNNKDYVVQEVKESKELFYLLGKSRTNKLTEYEKRIVNEQLIDILKTIPAFVIIALPFTFITLPTLISMLPKNAFPSAFQE